MATSASLAAAPLHVCRGQTPLDPLSVVPATSLTAALTTSGASRYAGDAVDACTYAASASEPQLLVVTHYYLQQSVLVASTSCGY